MNPNRRDFGKLALAAAASGLMMAAERPNSFIGDVRIGTITYSYRSEPGVNDAASLLKMIVDSEIGAIELMPPAAEIFAGAPIPTGNGGRARSGAEQKAAAEALMKWRLSASMDKFREFRKIYNDAGVSIYCHKLFPAADMSDAEFDYFFLVAAALGAKQISLELSDDLAYTQRLGDRALKHGMVAAYHAHERATITAWDKVLAQSKGNAVNIDCGHYYAGTGLSPIPALEKLHERIASCHLKDRTPTTARAPGANLPWGQGSTPIVEILKTIQKNKWRFPAAIELEYRIPEGSNAVLEVKKCVEFCRKALT